LPITAAHIELDSVRATLNTHNSISNKDTANIRSQNILECVFLKV